MNRSPTRKSYESFPLLFPQKKNSKSNNDKNLSKPKSKPGNRIPPLALSSSLDLFL